VVSFAVAFKDIIYLPKLLVFEPVASCHLLESGIGFGLVLFQVYFNGKTGDLICLFCFSN